MLAENRHRANEDPGKLTGHHVHESSPEPSNSAAPAAGSSAAPSRAPTLRLRGLTKRFGALVANEGVSLDAWPGEVHCLLGENGAGKSTLISMLAGMQQPDSGRIEIDGQPTSFASPREALARGIGVVYQHSALIPSMSVIENLMLAQRGGLKLDQYTARAHLKSFNGSTSAGISSDTLVRDLSLGQRQQLEIAKAMWANPRVLVLDEPTSLLADQAVNELLDQLRGLASLGVAVILITHKLDEALALGDRITVLRSGRVVRQRDVRGVAADQIGQLRAGVLQDMFGEAAPGQARGGETAPRPARVGEAAQSLARAGEQHAEVVTESQRAHGAELLRVEGVSTSGEGAEIHGVSLSARAGEILGVAGIDGHGQRHLAEVIAGQRAPASGRILLDGDDITRLTVRGRQQLGVRYLTDDRLHEGIAGSFSVALNLLLKRIGERPFWRFGRIRQREIDAHAAALIERYGIRPAEPALAAGTLSGGNIQKILLARELDGNPKVVVFNKPSYGLDVRTVARVHESIRDLARAGAAVLLISTDLDELAALSDWVAVISAGQLSEPIENDAHMRDRVGELIVSGAHHGK